MTRNVTVIIAAWNAAATIGRAIASALREPEVAEVVVVDDASTDHTSETARTADDSTDRLRIIVLPANRGPAFARNHAIDNSAAPLISILDADDFFFEGRFRNLLEGDDWDLAADNIVFIDHQSPETASRPPQFLPDAFFVDLQSFVEASTARWSSYGELAFLHPVMRREFLDRYQLRYDVTLRLGEDYDLYARALAKGARFKVVRTCGYGAMIRPDSLSRRHSTLDLKRFCDADDAIQVLCSAGAQTAVRAHQRGIRARYELRRFLDVKSCDGLVLAIIHGATNPAALPAIVGGIAADKLRAFTARTNPSPNQMRFLLPGRVAEASPTTELAPASVVTCPPKKLDRF
jgi:succinoglycan biosynthesis protein ExoU